MKLINVDTARRIIDSPRSKTQMLAMLEQTPTVEITRCRDCVYHNPVDMDGWCDAWGIDTTDDAFCSYGKGGKNETD